MTRPDRLLEDGAHTDIPGLSVALADAAELFSEDPAMTAVIATVTEDAAWISADGESELAGEVVEVRKVRLFGGKIAATGSGSLSMLWAVFQVLEQEWERGVLRLLEDMPARLPSIERTVGDLCEQAGASRDHVRLDLFIAEAGRGVVFPHPAYEPQPMPDLGHRCCPPLVELECTDLVGQAAIAAGARSVPDFHRAYLCRVVREQRAGRWPGPATSEGKARAFRSRASAA